MESSSGILNQAHPLVLFDGVCNLCDASVRFIIQRDPKKKFRFASLQSPLGQKILEEIHLPSGELHTMVLVEDSRCFLKSSAALHVSKKMKGLWPLLFAFIIVPPFIRNRVYDWVARNRYHWFGKKEECLIPSPDLKDRFLE
jgi:predicted DCC family thiol-disulfide oxidoreductase YuxK